MQDIQAPTQRMPPSTPGGTPRWLYGAVVAAVAAVALLAIVAIVLLAGDDNSTGTDTTAASTVPPSTTAAPTTTTTATTASATSATIETTTTSTVTTTASTTTSSTTSAPPTTVPAATPAVWPWADSSIRYQDPVEAALGFASDFVGFDDPIAGPFLAGDSRSGEVEIRAVETGPVTTVFVRQLGDDDTWWVLGSATENIVVDEPDALATIDDPLTVRGEGRALTGVIEVQIRADGRPTPLGTEIVIASGVDELLPFEASVAWSATDAERGAVVFITRTAGDAAINEASVVRVVLDQS